MELLELTKSQQQYGHSAVGTLQRGACLDFELASVWQLGQRIARRKCVGMLLSRDASCPFAPLVYDAANTEHH